jgi:hypothetical protein
LMQNFKIGHHMFIIEFPIFKDFQMCQIGTHVFKIPYII